MTPKYGSVAELAPEGQRPIRVMVIAPRHFHDSSTVDGHSWAVILSGETPYDGATRGPGYIGPIQNAGSWVKWLDDGA